MKNDMDLNKELGDILERKYNEIQQWIDTKKRFYKIYQLEGNAIGQIGETFLKKILTQIGVEIENNEGGTLHDEYDIKTKNGVTIEVKTARHGSNDSFQFNGINPSYNVDFIICIGICENEALYRIITKNKELSYIHEKNKRGWYIKNSNFTKKLVSMNPGNDVNYKLTLSKKNLFSIDSLVAELEKILKNK